VIDQKLSSVYLAYMSCDILPENNIYSVIYKEMGMFLPILTPDYAPFSEPKHMLVAQYFNKSRYLSVGCF